MTQRKLSTRHITWLMLGGAFVLSAPSCGGRAGENSASGGEASTMGASRDEDGDGVLDSLGMTFDRDKDGKPDPIDVDDDGQDDGIAVDTDGDGKPDGVGLDTDGDGIIDAIDTDGDGKPDDVGSTSGDGDVGSGGDAGDRDSGSGGDATSTGDGDGDTGSGGNAGDGDGDASGGTGGDDDRNAGVHTLGDSCGSPGDLGCAGENQKLQLLCDGSKWVANGTCNGTAVCDTGEANRGSCQEPIEGCEVPSDEFCDGTELRACGADRLGGERLEGCCGQGQHLTECCPETEKNVFDCSNDCENKSEECLLGAESTCAYLDEISVSSLPAVVRTPAGDEICPTVQSDGCQEEFFAIYFKDSTRSYRVELPEGVTVLAGPLPEGFDSWGSPCLARANGWLPIASCVSVRPMTEADEQTSYWRAGVLVNVPFGAGGRNLKISEGECPE